MVEEQSDLAGEEAVEYRISQFHNAILGVGFKQNSLVDAVALLSLGVETMRRAGVPDGEIMKSIIVATMETSRK